MANASTTGFGLKPIKMYGNGYESMGLGEYPVAASSDAIYFQDAVCQAATGYVIVGIATTTDIIGSLNGVFYTDATTSKPTFQNHLQASNTATDIVALVNDNPLKKQSWLTAIPVNPQRASRKKSALSTFSGLLKNRTAQSI